MTVMAASLVDTDGSETGAVYLATNASAGELAVVYLVNGSSRVELETIEGYMHHHESSAPKAAATLYNMTVTPEHSYSYGCTCGCDCPYEPTTCDEALVMSGHDSTATDSFAGCASDCDDCVLQYLASEIGCSHVYDNISSFNCDLAYDDMGSSLDDTGSWNDDMGGHRQLFGAEAGVIDADDGVLDRPFEQRWLTDYSMEYWPSGTVQIMTGDGKELGGLNAQVRGKSQDSGTGWELRELHETTDGMRFQLIDPDTDTCLSYGWDPTKLEMYSCENSVGEGGPQEWEFRRTSSGGYTIHSYYDVEGGSGSGEDGMPIGLVGSEAYLTWDDEREWYAS